MIIIFQYYFINDKAFISGVIRVQEKTNPLRFKNYSLKISDSDRQEYKEVNLEKYPHCLANTDNWFTEPANNTVTSKQVKNKEYKNVPVINLDDEQVINEHMN
jgi:hypothetical protein